MKVQSTITTLILALFPLVLHAQTTIYSDTFSGDTTALNGQTTTTGGGTWSANLGATTAGAVTTRGSAIVALGTPLDVGTIYTLSLDIAYASGSATTSWIGLGLTSATTVGNAASAQAADRFAGANVPGYAWGFVSGVGALSVFAGPLAANPFTTTGLTYAVPGNHNLKAIYTTASDGNSFTVDFLVDGVSALVGGAQTVNTTISTIKAVGMSDNSTLGAGTAWDNFSFTMQPVPEPSSIMMLSLGFGGLVCWHRFRRK